MPIDPKISWEGHLSGFVIGLLLAFVFREVPIENKKYEWEKEDFNPEEDDFIRQFDENGNFIEKLPEVKEPTIETPVIEKPVRIIYTLTKTDKPEDKKL